MQIYLTKSSPSPMDLQGDLEYSTRSKRLGMIFAQGAMCLGDKGKTGESGEISDERSSDGRGGFCPAPGEKREETARGPQVSGGEPMPPPEMHTAEQAKDVCCYQTKCLRPYLLRKEEILNGSRLERVKGGVAVK